MTRVLFILEQERSFVARTLVSELEKRDIEVVVEKADVSRLRSVEALPKLWFMYFDDPENPKVIEVLEHAEKCVRKYDTRFFIGGAKSEIDFLLKNHSGDMIADIFERPFNADDVSERLKDEEGNLVRSFYAKKILVVDDDSVQLHSMKNLLEKNYRVYTANSGLNALKLLAKIHVDLILLDYEMPTVKGPEVAEMIKSNPDLEGIPIMFLTAKNDVQSVVKAKDTGTVDYILKSTAVDVILDKLKIFFAEKSDTIHS